MLEAVGIPAPDERVYRSLLVRPTVPVGDLAADTGLSAVRVRRALALLEEKGLVSRSPGGRHWVPAPPDVALEVLVMRQQHALQDVRVAGSELLRHYRAEASTRASIEIVEIVSGGEAVRQRIEQIQRASAREVLMLDRPPYIAPTPGPNPIELELLERGVAYRVIYDRTSFEREGRIERMRTLARAGEGQRVLTGVPLKLIVADRDTALVPWSVDPDTAISVLVHASPLLDALVALFESLWGKAPPMRFDRPVESAPGEGPGLSDEDRQILVLLASGLKDSAIAKHLGLAERTLTRRVRHLLDAMGTTSRFQAGHIAGLRGWLT